MATLPPLPPFSLVPASSAPANGAAAAAAAAASASGSGVGMRKSAELKAELDAKETHQKMKIDSAVKENFDSLLAEAKAKWQEYNQAKAQQQKAELIKLSSIPMGPEQEKIYRAFLRTLNTPVKPAPTEQELIKLNSTLINNYIQSLKEQTCSPNDGIKFLTEAVKEQQTDLIKVLLQHLDLTKCNYDEVYECLSLVAKSNPTIVKLFLQRDPSIFQIVNYNSYHRIAENLYILSFNFQDIDLFKSLIRCKIDSDKGAEAAASSDCYGQYLEELLQIPALYNSYDGVAKFLFIAVESRAKRNCEIILNQFKEHSISPFYLIKSFVKAMQINDDWAIQLIIKKTPISHQAELLFWSTFSKDPSLSQQIVHNKVNATDALFYVVAQTNYPHIEELQWQFTHIVGSQNCWESVPPPDFSNMKISPFEFKSYYQLIGFPRGRNPFLRLIELGADINALNSKGISFFTWCVKHDLYIPIFDLFMSLNADFIVSKDPGISAFSALCQFANLDKIQYVVEKLSKILPRSKFVEMLNLPIYQVKLNPKISKYLFEKKCIDIQLCTEKLLNRCLVDNESNTDNIEILKFLVSKGGKPFRSRIFRIEDQTVLPPFLALCQKSYQYFLILRQEEEYKKHSQTQSNGIGLLTHLAISSYSSSYTVAELKEAITNAISDLSNIANKQIIIKDVICAYMLLYPHVASCATPLSPLLPKTATYPFLLACKQECLKLVPRNPEGLEKAFDSLCMHFESTLFTLEFNLQESSRATALLPNQNSQIAQLDYSSQIEEFLKTVDLANCKIEGNVKEFQNNIYTFMTHLKKRISLLGSPSSPPLSGSVEQNRKLIAFKKKCREILSPKDYLIGLKEFALSKKLNTQLNKPYAILLEIALQECNDGIQISNSALEEFAKSEESLENFFLDIEERLRFILYPYALQRTLNEPNAKFSSAASSSTSAAAAAASTAMSSSPSSFDRDFLFKLLATMISAMRGESTWIADLHHLEQIALEKIHKLNRKIGVFHKQSELERQLHPVLMKLRSTTTQTYKMLMFHVLAVIKEGIIHRADLIEWMKLHQIAPHLTNKEDFELDRGTLREILIKLNVIKCTN